MGSDLSGLASDGSEYYGYKPQKAKNIADLLADLDKLNKTSKNYFVDKNTFFLFALDQEDAIVPHPLEKAWPNWKEQIRIQVKLATLTPEYSEHFCKYVHFEVFYMIYTRMQTEVSIHCMNNKIQNDGKQTNDENGDIECIICMDNKGEIVLECNHFFCEKCINQWNLTSATCPYCRRATSLSADSTWSLVDAPLSRDEVAQSIHQFIEKIPSMKQQTLPQQQQQQQQYQQQGSVLVGPSGRNNSVATVSVTFPRIFEEEPIIIVTPRSVELLEESFVATVYQSSRSGFKCVIKKMTFGKQYKASWQQQLQLDWIARVRDDVESGRTVVGINDNSAEVCVDIPIPSALLGYGLLPCFMASPYLNDPAALETFAVTVEELNIKSVTLRIRRVSLQFKNDWELILMVNWMIFYPASVPTSTTAMDILTYQIPENEKECAQCVVKFVKQMNSIPIVAALSSIKQIACPIITIQGLNKDGFTAVLQKSSPEQTLIGILQLSYVAVCATK